MRLSFILLFLALTAASCSKFAKVQKSNDYEYKLRMAEKYYVAKKYHFASQLYSELFPLLKGQPQFEDLFYKYAYCSYYLKDWMNAESLFKQFVEVFPNSPRAEEMEYMRSYTYFRQSPKAELDQTNTQKTIGLMQTFINTHPESPRVKEATEIIDKCRRKMEEKAQKSAGLYYNMGHFRAAAIAYTSLMNDFPDSEQSEDYKFQIIKSYYQFATNSIEDKKPARYEQVVTECNDFVDRFPDSKLRKEVENYLNLSKNNLKATSNEQAKTPN
ncbi:outer membrane protein assembly factor BamD [Pseudoflavitalea sp. G-6-1-2]|uniref:outer membrane protein assembly factor BamD n=1 Tax=Pseudoflavitalea sp. G-6-1-2 TaxID=2728841 RepID=UPI00146A3D75|nr:outer membrane protein assembly factor BamD [Pseudoflavitalea sp. G-6-1-2]NML22659.1 outer membrane protein assembly factor BamD [Pseudoflavitalea sp. G-6-1-2]